MSTMFTILIRYRYRMFDDLNNPFLLLLFTLIIIYFKGKDKSSYGTFYV